MPQLSEMFLCALRQNKNILKGHFSASITFCNNGNSKSDIVDLDYWLDTIRATKQPLGTVA